MSISRKEDGSLVRKAGLGIVDNILNRFSHNAISNSAVTEAITEINNELTELITKVPTIKMTAYTCSATWANSDTSNEVLISQLSGISPDLTSTSQIVGMISNIVDTTAGTICNPTIQSGKLKFKSTYNYSATLSLIGVVFYTVS